MEIFTALKDRSFYFDLCGLSLKKVECEKEHPKKVIVLGLLFLGTYPIWKKANKN